MCTQLLWISGEGAVLEFLNAQFIALLLSVAHPPWARRHLGVRLIDIVPCVLGAHFNQAAGLFGWFCSAIKGLRATTSRAPKLWPLNRRRSRVCICSIWNCNVAIHVARYSMVDVNVENVKRPGVGIICGIDVDMWIPHKSSHSCTHDLSQSTLWTASSWTSSSGWRMRLTTTQ